MPSSSRSSGPGERLAQFRGFRREKIFEPATMRRGTVIQRAHLLDLSCAGALINAAEPPEADEVVIVTCRGLQVAGRVQWRVGTRFGVKFITEIPELAVNQLVEGSV